MNERAPAQQEEFKQMALAVDMAGTYKSMIVDVSPEERRKLMQAAYHQYGAEMFSLISRHRRAYEAIFKAAE